MQLFLLLALFISGYQLSVAVALDCVQPAENVKAGQSVNIPSGAMQPVALPPNFNCTYQITVPKMVWAQVRLENELKGGNDMITVRDAMGKKTIVASRSAWIINFYVFPGTTSTFQVSTKSVNVGSKFRMHVVYAAMPSPIITQLSSHFKYSLLNDLQVNSMKQPLNVRGNGQVTLTVANSLIRSDVFDNYFVIDGTFSTHRKVRHLSDYLYNSFISTGNNLTIVGLDNLVSMSSVIFSNVLDTQQFYDFTGFTTSSQPETIQVDGIRKRDGLTVISKNTDNVIITGLNYPSGHTTDCSIKAYTPPVTVNSQLLLDFSTIKVFPYTLNQKYFTIIVENCSVAISMYSE